MTVLDLAQQIGLKPKWVAGTGGGEYHSSCPVCGGIDRFYIQPNRKMSKCLGCYSCRQCGISGDAIQFARQFLGYSFQEAAEAANATITERIGFFMPSLPRVQKPITLQKLPALWIERATKLVSRAHANLLHKQEVLSYLESRGLPMEAILRYKLGWAEQNEFLPRNSWGLEEQVDQHGKKSIIWIPKGLVIPVAEADGKVIRLKVRRFDWQEGDKLPKYVAISGSMNGLSIIGSSGLTNIAVVESELDAYAIDHVAHDLVCTIAVGSNIKNPDNVTDYLAKNAKHLLICRDNDNAGKKMLKKWKEFYTHAREYQTPVGKDIGEAIQNGFNVREWILKALHD